MQLEELLRGLVNDDGQPLVQDVIRTAQTLKVRLVILFPTSWSIGTTQHSPGQ